MAFLTMNVRNGPTYAGLRLVTRINGVASSRAPPRFSGSCDHGATCAHVIHRFMRR